MEENLEGDSAGLSLVTFRATQSASSTFSTSSTSFFSFFWDDITI
jgi:hypothetical protein